MASTVEERADGKRDKEDLQRAVYPRWACVGTPNSLHEHYEDSEADYGCSLSVHACLGSERDRTEDDQEEAGLDDIDSAPGSASAALGS